VPSGLVASAITALSLTLSWSASTDNIGVAGYRVYRDGVLAVSSAGTSVQLTGLAAATLYSFTVAAFDLAGNTSAPSAALPLTMLPPLLDTLAPSTPTGLVASALAPTLLTLSWTASVDNVAVAGYRVYRNGVLVASPVIPTAAISGLVANTQYSFTVSAFDAAGNASPQSAPLSVTTPAAAPAPRIMWRAGMESGNLGEWSEKVNSGAADSWAVTAASEGIPPKSGNWVMKQSVTGTVGGSRMQRYPEINSLTAAGTTFYVSWWDYYPAKLTNSGSPYDFMFAIFEIASLDPIPVGQWVYFEVMITPSSTFNGAVKLWMNGEVIFDQSNVKTRYPDVGIGGMMWTAHAGYGSYINPTPATHYIDDVTISLGRLPYAP
jgi:chitodextrinase